MLRRLALGFSCVCVSLFLVGATCSKQPPRPKPRPFDVHFSIGSGLSGASVRVDVIGTSAESDLPRLEQHRVSDYWRKDDKLRLESARKSFVFRPEGPREDALLATDEIWTSWLRAGAEVLVIIADWPGAHTDRPGASDPRRFIVSIDERVWGNVRKLEFVVQESGIRLITTKPSR